MPFVTRAKQFLENPGVLATHKKLPEMKETVRYMLENAVGLGNAVSTKQIVEHLKRKGCRLENERDWQINVLGPLRRDGIFIASKRATGMFIIKDQSDAQVAISQIIKRIDEETKRLQILKKMVTDVGWRID